MICCLFSSGIIISCCSCSSGCSGLLFNELILSAILFPIKSSIACAYFSKLGFAEVLANLRPSFSNALPYLLLLNIFAAVIPLFTILLPYLFPIFLPNLTNHGPVHNFDIYFA